MHGVILKPKAKGDDDKTPTKMAKMAKKRRNSNRSPTPDDAALRNPDAKGRYFMASALLGGQGCQMAKFDPFLSLDCARVEGVGAQSQGKEGIKFCSAA